MTCTDAARDPGPTADSPGPAPRWSRRSVALRAPWAAWLALLAGPALGADAAPAAPAVYRPRLLAREDALADVALMRRALEVIHPGLERRRSRHEIAAAFDRLEQALQAPVDELVLYREISRLLAEVRCSHTKAEQPPGFERWRREQPSHLPFRFRLVQGRMLVVSCADPAVPPGAEVLAVNGQPVAALVQVLGGLVPLDGDTVWSRATALADDGDLMGADFDHFYPYLFGLPSAWRLRLRDHDGAQARELELAPLSFQRWLGLDNRGRRHHANLGDSTRWRMLDARTGLLQVDTFVNYRRPVDANALFAGALEDLRSAGAQRLVLDLRANGGGSDDAALALLDHLALSPYTYLRAMRLKAVRYGDLPAHIETWGDRQALFEPPLEQFTRTADGWYERRAADQPALMQPRAPAAAAFRGPLTVLTSPVNASGATMAIATLREMGRARLVGGRCGGSADGPTAGRIFLVKLPASGIRVRVPLVLNVTAVTRFDAGGGLVPDLEVEDTVADFRAGRDAVLEAALARWTA